MPIFSTLSKRKLYNPGYYFSFDLSTIPGLQLWLSTRYPASMFKERTSPTTLAAANGDPVGTWQDLSGNARHVTAGADSNRPTLKLNDISGNPSIQLDLSDDKLESAALASTIQGTLIEVTKEGILVFTAQYGNTGNTKYFIGIRKGQQNILEKLHWNRTLTASEIAQATTFYRTWVPTDSYSTVTNFSNYWYDRKDLITFPTIDTSSGTNFQTAWYNCTSLTSFPLLNTSNATNFFSTWSYCSSLTSFPLLDTSKGTDFSATWNYCSSLTSFPLLDTSSGTSFFNAWYGCSSLTSFPAINTSMANTFYSAWRGCSSLTSFPLLDTSNGITFAYAWMGCSSLTSFPALNFSSATGFLNGWRDCSSLTTFPANMFDNTSSTGYVSAFVGCALTQTSVDNILVSISTAATNKNLNNGTLNMTGGTSATPSATGLAAKTVLTNRGWTVTHN